MMPSEASRLLFVRAKGLLRRMTRLSVGASMIVGTDLAVAPADVVNIGMMCVSHGMVTMTFDEPLRNSSIVSVPPNILRVGLFGAGRHGTYLFPFECLRMSAMII